MNHPTIIRMAIGLALLVGPVMDLRAEQAAPPAAGGLPASWRQMAMSDCPDILQSSYGVLRGDECAYLYRMAMEDAGEDPGNIVQKYQELVAKSPEDMPLLYNLGAALYNAGRETEAAASLSLVTEKLPRHAEAAFLLGNLAEKSFHAENDRKWLKTAERRYRQAIKAVPEFAEAYCNLGALLSCDGREKEGAALRSRAESLRPGIRCSQTQPRALEVVLSWVLVELGNMAKEKIKANLIERAGGYAAKTEVRFGQLTRLNMPKLKDKVYYEVLAEEKTTRVDLKVRKYWLDPQIRYDLSGYMVADMQVQKKASIPLGSGYKLAYSQTKKDTAEITVKKRFLFFYFSMAPKSGADAAARADDLTVIERSALIRAPAPARASKAKPTLHVLAVGVSRYGDSRVPQLKFAHSDADEIASIFKTQEDGPLFGRVVTRLLRNNEATRKGILEALRRVHEEASSDDVVILFLAGHGMRKDTGSYCFMPYDSTAAAPCDNGLSRGDIDEAIKDLREDKHGGHGVSKIVLLLDTCHSGAAGAAAAGNIAEGLTYASGVYILSSSRPEQDSAESERFPLGKYKGHGLFTYAILKSLGSRKSATPLDMIVDVVNTMRTELPGQEPYMKTEGSSFALWSGPANDMAAIPAGEFWMGSRDGIGREDESPRHRVYLDAFLLDAAEVTAGEYRRFARETGHMMRDQPPWSNADHPAVDVTWADARAYCQWAGKRLPTEAEWEKAARGGSESIWPFGDAQAALADYGWFHRNADRRTHPVKGKKPNGFGLYDMLGNASEWVSDFYAAGYYGQRPPGNPTGPAAGSSRVMRGGSWLNDFDNCRPANRLSSDAGVARNTTGFRCARN